MLIDSCHMFRSPFVSGDTWRGEYSMDLSRDCRTIDSASFNQWFPTVTVWRIFRSGGTIFLNSLLQCKGCLLLYIYIYGLIMVYLSTNIYIRIYGRIYKDMMYKDMYMFPLFNGCIIIIIKIIHIPTRNYHIEMAQCTQLGLSHNEFDLQAARSIDCASNGTSDVCVCYFEVLRVFGYCNCTRMYLDNGDSDINDYLS